MRILFVDDETKVLHGLRRLLFSRRDRWHLSFAADGAQAQQLLTGGSFDVIVSDVRMPRMSGIELLAEAGRRQPHLVRVLLSGQVDPAAAAHATAVAHRFLSKPCGSAELIATLEDAERVAALPSALRDVVAGPGELPSCPALRRQLDGALADAMVTARQLAGIIEQDVAMAAKALQVVGSSFLGPARPCADVRQAVAAIGGEGLRRLGMGAGWFGASAPEPRIEGFTPATVSPHGHRCADALRRASAADPGESPAAALLQDVGQLALAVRAPKRLAANLAESRATGEPLHIVESRNDGFTHADVGAGLLRLWGVPEGLADLVAGHHAESGEATGPGGCPSPIEALRTEYVA